MRSSLTFEISFRGVGQSLTIHPDGRVVLMCGLGEEPIPTVVVPMLRHLGEELAAARAEVINLREMLLSSEVCDDDLRRLLGAEEDDDPSPDRAW